MTTTTPANANGTPHPAKTWDEIQRAHRALDEEYLIRCGSAAFDMACDLAPNDRGARLRELAAERLRLRREQEGKQRDIQAAQILLGVREGSLGIKEGKIVGALSIDQVDAIAVDYPECLAVWNAVRVAAGLPPLDPAAQG